MTEIITAAYFKKASAFDKGYMVYMLGAREDQLNVPESYTPKTEKAKKAYAKGQQNACMNTLDGDDE